MTDTDLRDQLKDLLAWKDAHAGFEKAVGDCPIDVQGRRPPGLPHSPWELLEHLRIAQHDILDFCRNPNYQAMKWPDDYWPPSPQPPDEQAWQRSVAQFIADRQAVQAIVDDRSIDLGAKIPHGDGHTYFREIVLVVDHNSHHIGQLILVRRLLGAWG